MTKLTLFTFLLSLVAGFGCTGPSSGGTQPSSGCYPGIYTGAATSSSWADAKVAAVPVNNLPSEFSTPYAQPLATGAWEDGVYITRDGLNLYAIFEPADLLSFVLSGDTPDLIYTYARGPQIGQDFSNPTGQSTPWFHADIVHASRSSTDQSFGCWRLTGLKTTAYNRGAPVGIMNTSDPQMFDFFAYTADNPTASTPTGGTKIRLVTNESAKLNVQGQALPANVAGNAYIQDNPHLERVVTSDPNQLALFFESTNWPGSPGGSGSHAILYTTSSDGGSTWQTPAFVTTVNTASGQEQQPHLYYDGSQWWLYFSATNPNDGKLAIYRSAQQTMNNWDAWGARQLVISAGTSDGVGEPTLTSHGDLSYVVVIRNQNGTSKDQFDADPWFLPHR